MKPNENILGKYIGINFLSVPDFTSMNRFHL